MSDTEKEYIVRYMMGRTAFDAAFDTSRSDSDRVEQLDQAAWFFEEALKSAPDEESEMDCHRLLGAVLFTQNFCNPVEIGKSGLSSFPGLNKAVAEQEKALELDARIGGKFFSDRAIASEVLLRLDTVWSYESFHIDQQSGASEAAKYLEAKLKLLDYLGGIKLPGTCFALFMHYSDQELGSSEYYFAMALNWLQHAANAESFDDAASGLFYSAALEWKRKAKEQLAQFGVSDKEDLPTDTDSDQTPLALHHYNTAASAMKQNNHSTAIHHFDECLCTNPHAEIAIAAWFNLATVIIRKHRFPDRVGDTVSDEEYKWHECVSDCFAKVIEVYDEGISSRPAVKKTLQTYMRAKDKLKTLPAYGLVFTDARGNTKQRDFEKIKNLPRPPIRCLGLFPPNAERQRNRAGRYVVCAACQAIPSEINAMYCNTCERYICDKCMGAVCPRCDTADAIAGTFGPDRPEDESIKATIEAKEREKLAARRRAAGECEICGTKLGFFEKMGGNARCKAHK